MPSLTTLGTALNQNFDTLANSGTSSTLPSGWFISETGTSATVNGQYAAGTGSGNAGDTYSFGAAGSTDRALGSLRSGSNAPTIGAQFTNDTGAVISSLQIAYTGEQWRLGALGRTDRLDFQISFDATSLTTGTWTDVNALDFTAPITAGTVGALDGNAVANRTAAKAHELRHDFAAHVALQTGGYDELAGEAFDVVVWSMGVEPPPIAEKLGVATDPRGWIRVGTSLECDAAPGVFAGGDIVQIVGPSGPVPAMRRAIEAIVQASAIAKSVLAVLDAAERGQTYALAPYRPLGDFPHGVSLGARSLLVLGPFCFDLFGFTVWFRRFLLWGYFRRYAPRR